MTQWNKMDRGFEPNINMVSEYIRNQEFDKLYEYLVEQYAVSPTFEYSGCSVPGWNIKFKKAGRNLCTIYPMEGYFVILIVIGKKEKEEFEQNFSSFSPYLQDLYTNTKEGMGQRWLMIEVEDADIIEDVKKCISIRRGIKK